MPNIRPNAEPAATAVAAGDVFLIDGSTGVRALAATAVVAVVAGKVAVVNNSLTFAGVDGKTLTVNNSLTLAGTDGTTQTFPSTSGAVVTSASVNAVTNAMRAQMAAWTLKGNATSGTANEADITIDGLTLKASPAAGDELMMWDVSASALKKTTASALSGSGVTSINGLNGALKGILTGTRLAKVAAYAVATADVGSTLALGGNAFFPLTIPNPSGFTAPFVIKVINEDVGRGKLLLPFYTSSATSLAIGTGTKAFTVASGLSFGVTSRFRAYSLANSANWMAGTVSYASTTATFTVDAIGGSGTFADWQIAPEVMLWPRQSTTVEFQNSVWQVSGPGRYIATAPVAVWFDPAGSGNNSNDGLASSAPFNTITAAYVALNKQVDHRGNFPAINIMAGTFTELLAAANFGPHLNAPTTNLIGAGSTLTTWKPVGACLQNGNLANFQIQGIKFDNTGGANDCIAITTHQTGVVDIFSDVEFGVFPGTNSSYFNSDNGAAKFNIMSPYKWSGDVAFHWNLGSGAQVLHGNVTVTITNTPVCLIFMRLFGAGTCVQYSGVATYSGAVAAGHACFNINGPSFIYTSGTSFPGTGTGNSAINGGVLV